MYTDEYFMREALKEARKAFDLEEVPVGCVIVAGDRIIARGHNLMERLNDVTAHAEMQAITSASNALGGKFLHECRMYVSVEPCLMCAGAIAWSRVGRLIYGAPDTKNGYSRYHPNPFHPKTVVESGLMAEEAGEMMSEFFRGRR
jgi:tRNA(adenine34) deaminase